MEQLIEICTDHMSPALAGESLISNRDAAAAAQQQAAQAEVTVIVQCYNRLERTKRCIESILQYTAGIDYELVLLDNGSEDGTLEYLHSVRFEKKRIYHITKNIGAGYPATVMNVGEMGRFICSLPNDLIVTPRWLENLLLCIRSDPKIGMVTPVCSNVSNLQEVQLPYRSYAEMQRQAERFNRSDPGKWEDRQRLITLGTLYRKEVFLGIGWPPGDVGFFHDFMDDDVAFSVRRLGYRTVLAGDTWVCHDHDFRRGDGKDPAEFQRSLEIGRANFREKYFGVDAWEDVNNYYIPYLPHFPQPEATGKAAILGIDVRCGTPILDVRNWLRRFGIFDAELSAFTEDPKYWVDLKTISSGSVLCDREEFLPDSFAPGYFDYVIADRPLNRYHEPQKIINTLFALCRDGGIVTCRLKNTFSFLEYVHMLGQPDVYDAEFAYNVPLEVLQAALERKGKVQAVLPVPFGLGEEQRQALAALLPAGTATKDGGPLLDRLLCREFLLIVKKNGATEK